MLTFNLKKEWFEKIKSGEKTHEYREFKPYWTRIFKKEFGELEFSVIELRFGTPKFFDQEHKICFMNGMFPEEKRPRVYAKLKSLSLKYGLDTDLKINKPVYDIEFELIEKQEEPKEKIELQQLYPDFDAVKEILEDVTRKKYGRKRQI